MSGYNNPMGGHRGQFNPQQQQQQQQQMNQMAGGMSGMGGQNTMAGNQAGAGMQMGGGVGPGYAQGGGMMMPVQQSNTMPMQMGMQGMGAGMAGVGGMGAMNPVGMQSPSHAQQQMLQQQQQQQAMHMQQQQQQQMMANSPQMGGMMSQAGAVGAAGMPAQAALMQQQQQQQQLPQQQQQMGCVPVMSNQSLGGVGAGIPMQQHVQQQQSQQQAQQQQQSTQLGNAQPAQGANSMLAISQPNSHKEINIVALSRLGQETVQDITSRFQEIFSALKIIQPTANRDNNTEKKVQEYFRTIRLLFKRVRIIYEKCNDGYPQGMEYANVDNLIPFKDEPEHRNEPTQCEEYRRALQENQELIETVKLKNRQLREIIDRTRIIIWEINTMLAMRRT